MLAGLSVNMVWMSSSSSQRSGSESIVDGFVHDGDKQSVPASQGGEAAVIAAGLFGDVADSYRLCRSS